MNISSDFTDIPLAEADPYLCKFSLIHHEKNRYTDVLAPDATLVALSSGDYINANFVTIDPLTSSKVIACQAPMPSTFYAFWLMCFEQKVDLIVMLTDFYEKGVLKCDLYFPSKLNPLAIYNECLSSPILVSYKSHRNVNVEISEMVFDVSFDGVVREICHLHYRGWIDRSTPEIESLKICLDFVYPFTPSSLVKQIRTERHGLVQTREQYKFIDSASRCVNVKN